MINKILNISWVTNMLKVRPLCTFSPKISIYKRNFDKTRCIYFSIKDRRFCDKNNEIQGNVKIIVKKEFNSELVYDKKYLKAKKD